MTERPKRIQFTTETRLAPSVGSEVVRPEVDEDVGPLAVRASRLMIEQSEARADIDPVPEGTDRILHGWQRTPRLAGVPKDKAAEAYRLARPDSNLSNRHFDGTAGPL